MTSLLGVRIDNIPTVDIYKKVQSAISGTSGSLFVTTLNAEILLGASKDQDYGDVLNSADLNMIDGVGVVYALKIRGVKSQHRITGADLLPFILEQAQAQLLHVHFILHHGGLVQWSQLRESLAQQYPHLRVSGAMIAREESDLFAGEIVGDIVICNFGAPYQENFLFKVKNDIMATPRLMIGVGGACDFLVGTIKRAPYWMRKSGLEWMYRLMQHPLRFGRIVRAVLIFPLTILIKEKRVMAKEFIDGENVSFDRNNHADYLAHWKSLDSEQRRTYITETYNGGRATVEIDYKTAYTLKKKNGILTIDEVN